MIYKKIRKFMIDIYKIKNELVPPIMDTEIELFLWSRNIKPTCPQLWTVLPEEVK